MEDQRSWQNQFAASNAMDGEKVERALDAVMKNSQVRRHRQMIAATAAALVLVVGATVLVAKSLDTRNGTEQVATRPEDPDKKPPTDPTPTVTTSQPVAVPDPNVLTDDAFFGVTFGMTVEEAEAALQVTFGVESNPDHGSCALYSVPNTDVVFLGTDGIIKSTSIGGETSSSDFHTDNGFDLSPGTEAELLNLYGDRVQVALEGEANPNAERSYKVLDAQDSDSAIVFDVLNGSVYQIRAGLAPEVYFYEGCY